MIRVRFIKTIMALIIGILFTVPVFAEGFITGKIKLPFEATVTLKNNKVENNSKTNLLLTFKIDEGSYLYKDSLSLKIKPISGVKIGKPVFPKSETKMDKFTKLNKQIYHKSFTVSVPVEVTPQAKSGKMQLASTVNFQGCSKTICYIPQEKNVSIPFEVVKKK
ncbi:MAG: protein-disulfide reductase DsbD N-terminal domain-containing protein [Candidatus Sericytochromatia bacterium]|nr:protein-disulfide reductase DsbD N-terminal domain-containing protein [Candidatus Sericytochromatia bacterium]